MLILAWDRPEREVKLHSIGSRYEALIAGYSSGWGSPWSLRTHEPLAEAEVLRHVGASAAGRLRPRLRFLRCEGHKVRRYVV